MPSNLHKVYVIFSSYETKHHEVSRIRNVCAEFHRAAGKAFGDA